MVDKNTLVKKMTDEIADEYDDPVQITTIPFWVGEEGESIEGFVSEPKYALPPNFGHNAVSYEITLLKAAPLTMAVGRAEAPAIRDVPAGEAVVLSTHTDLMQKMDELPIKQGYVLKISRLPDVEIRFTDRDGVEQVKQKKMYEVRPGKKNKK